MNRLRRRSPRTTSNDVRYIPTIEEEIARYKAR